ncbi:MAG: bis(5'-nucleosyl)-tetraphosphatase (symmetrical) YqeK [Elusimicrobiota bacterium]
MESITEKAANFIKKRLDSAKFKHSLGVTRAAVMLAVKHRVSIKDAGLAGMLHDVGRIYGPKELVRYVKRNGLKIPFRAEIMKYNPKLLHGFVGAHVALKYFTKKKDIIEAIAFHTLARPGISRLAKLIYVADYTAPDRRFPGLEKTRKTAARNLDAAFRAALSNKLLYVLKKKQWLHPLAVEAYNEELRLHRSKLRLHR